MLLAGGLSGCTGDATPGPAAAPSVSAPSVSAPSVGRGVGPAVATQACSVLPDSTAPARNPGLPAAGPALTTVTSGSGPALASRASGVDLQLALGTASSGVTRAAAEQSARDFLAVLLDSRLAVTGKQLVCALASPELSPAVAQFLAATRNGLRDETAPANRRWAVAAGKSGSAVGFYRSAVAGPVDRPNLVRIEFAVPVQAEVPRSTAWTIYRLAVRYVPDVGWRLADYFDSGAGPSGLTLSAANKARFLTGTGWRPLGPPA